MALVVETGAVVAGAESYVSVSDADTYWSNRNDTVWAALSTGAKEAALRIATRYLDSNYTWLGEIVNQDQLLDWPRYAVVDRDGRGYDSDEIPIALKDALCELAYQQSQAALDVADTSRKVTREKLGPMETEYTDYGSDAKTFGWIDKLVGKLTKGGSSTTRFTKG